MIAGQPLELKDIITLIIAAWGMILSTILAVREFVKARRNIILDVEIRDYEHIPDMSDGYPLMQIKVINIGQSPVVISSLILEIWEPMERVHWWKPEWEGLCTFYLSADDNVTLPALLKDSEYITFSADRMPSKKDKLKLRAFDIEGHTFTKYKASWARREDLGGDRNLIKVDSLKMMTAFPERTKAEKTGEEAGKPDEPSTQT